MIDPGQIAPWIEAYGNIGLLALSIIEGPIVTIAAGLMVKANLLNLWPALCLVILGDLIGDTILYLCGRGMRLDRTHIIKKWFHVPHRRIVPIIRAMREHSVSVLAFGKLTQAAGFPVLAAAGVARVPYLLFLTTNLLASIPKSAGFLLLGYYVGQVGATASTWLSAVSVATLGGLVLAGIWWMRRA